MPHLEEVFLPNDEPNPVVTQLFNDYKKSARKRGLLFELNKTSFISLISSACFYCGRLPNQRRTYKGLFIIRTGIDRMDNAIGYTEGNCVSCCKNCNYLKGRMVFSKFIKRLLKNG